MSFESKIESVKEIINQHNGNVDEDLQINFEKFLSNLKGMGGTTDQALVQCTWEDIESCGKEAVASNKLPRLLARQLASVFRKIEIDKKATRVFTEKKVLRMSIRELFEVYDPREDNPVSDRLKKLSGDPERAGTLQPCVVFNTDNTVNVTASVDCLQELKDDYSPRKIYVSSDGTPHEVRLVGYRPDDLVDENPLFPGNALRGADQACHQTHRPWKEIDKRTRTILWLAISTGELRILDNSVVHNTMDLLVGKAAADASKIVSQRYPLAVLRLQELEKEGRAPSLTIPRGKKRVARRNDPFFSGIGNRTY